MIFGRETQTLPESVVNVSLTEILSDHEKNTNKIVFSLSAVVVLYVCINGLTLAMRFTDVLYSSMFQNT